MSVPTKVSSGLSKRVLNERDVVSDVAAHVSHEMSDALDLSTIVGIEKQAFKAEVADSHLLLMIDGLRRENDIVLMISNPLFPEAVSDAVERYMADLVYATRIPGKYSEDLDRWIDVGGSPRASLALDKCGRTHAWLNGRDSVDPEDVRAVAHDVLRHRLMLSYEAQGEGITANDVVTALVEQVALP